MQLPGYNAGVKIIVNTINIVTFGLGFFVTSIAPLLSVILQHLN